ncbi:hypothetical protein [Carboxylicivirga linearis]|uniref:GAF domain-containing protein n=1 Tax=Carboxylicivirga linearis TaxID=1628157 RepID=A0ABS5JU31_9BACT|nr:hypothetical protein [Carboxylicivirga linearis]MBS2098353.1 hypothetical protein [Carboxylicivirga linearis]
MLLTVAIVFVLPVMFGAYAFFNKRLAEYLIRVKYNRPKIGVAFTITYISLGILIAVLTDLIDFSEIKSKNGIDGDFKVLKNNYESYHQNSEDQQTAFLLELDNFYSKVSPPKQTFNIILCIILSLVLTFYVALVILDKRTAYKISSNLQDLEQELHEEKAKHEKIYAREKETYRLLAEEAAIMNKLVAKKCQRLEKTIDGSKPDGKIPQCTNCSTIFSSRQQIEEACTEILKHISKSLNIAANDNCRIAFYIPDEKGEKLELFCANDNLGNRDCINWKKINKNGHFNLDAMAPESFAVQVYFSSDIVIIGDCINENFNYFYNKQKDHLKSIIGCPIIYNNEPIAVLLIDSGTEKIFDGQINKEKITSILKLFRHDYSLRVKHELLSQKYFELI